MLIYDDIFTWDGWGGKLRLASGKCQLRIFDLAHEEQSDVKILKSVIAVASDIGGQKISVRSCSGHIATMIVKRFDIDPNRMVWIEYCPALEYGKGAKVNIVPERYDIAEFTWDEGRAFQPVWRPLRPPMLDLVKDLME
ncbi:MAG: hypothetical protein JRI91_09815 [Deltaproteobacteria bacterium]|nr:hypothetical protein [Deltaproteobacteria bacterium]